MGFSRYRIMFLKSTSRVPYFYIVNINHPYFKRKINFHRKPDWAGKRILTSWQSLNHTNIHSFLVKIIDILQQWLGTLKLWARRTQLQPDMAGSTSATQIGGGQPFLPAPQPPPSCSTGTAGSSTALLQVQTKELCWGHSASSCVYTAVTSPCCTLVLA